MSQWSHEDMTVITRTHQLRAAQGKLKAYENLLLQSNDPEKEEGPAEVPSTEFLIFRGELREERL
jgi:hypothetical protein